MIDLLEWVAGLIGYIGLGLGIARSQARRVFKQATKENSGDASKAKAMYQQSLVGWVFFWPLRTLSAILRFLLEQLIIHPAEVTASWCADLIQAPVSTALKAIEDTRKQGEEWAKRAKDPEATDYDKEFAGEMRDSAFERHKEMCEDLGVKVPMRRELTSGASETPARGMDTAQEILKAMDMGSAPGGRVYSGHGAQLRHPGGPPSRPYSTKYGL